MDKDAELALTILVGLSILAGTIMGFVYVTHKKTQEVKAICLQQLSSIDCLYPSKGENK